MTTEKAIDILTRHEDDNEALETLAYKKRQEKSHEAKETMTKIIEGDAYELIKQLPTASVDLIMTDPPYSFGTRGGKISPQGDIRRD